MQFSTNVRNARADAIETNIGASPIMKIFTGAAPADCATADGAGTLLATVNLPSDWMAAASGGAKAKAGTWQDLSADGSGDAGHFRIYDNALAECEIQGTVTGTGGGGDMTLDNVTLVATQEFTVNSFTVTEGNA